MKKIIFILFAYFCLPSFGGIEGDCQPNRDQYRDKVWILGYEGFAHVQGYGNSLLTFNSDNTTDTSSFFGNMDFTAVSSSLCDTVGNLVCYTNGIYIADKTDNKMINGDSLDYGQYWEMYQNGGSGSIQGGVCVLPIPNKKNSVVLLYTDVEIGNSYVANGLKAAFIDLDKNNGKGVVVQKEIPIFTDVMQAHLATACRHANGRDWWIIAIKSGMGKYYKALLNPNGLVLQPPQTMPYLNGTERKSSVAYFSPNGKMYAHYNSEQGVWLYDFDRCTGTLSNRKLIPLFRAFRTPYAGLAFSPNSRYLYMNDDSQIAQYDLEATDIPASKIIVAEYDGFADTIGFVTLNTAFFLLQLAPNGKIYGATTGGNRYLHIIHNPDERGLACNVEQHGLRLPTFYNSTMPNFPNFRLGAERGTICDSLGIETGVTSTTASPVPSQVWEKVEIHVSPNPTSGECVLTVMSSLGGQKGRIRLLSLDGKVLETFFNPFLNQNNFSINLKNYAKGVYIAEYITQDGGSAREKIIRQ